MAFPHHHHHHRRDNDEEEDEPNYPPPGSRLPFSDPPPPPSYVHNAFHEPPPPSFVTHHSNFPSHGYEDSIEAPPPPPPIVHHSHHPNFPSGIHHTHQPFYPESEEPRFPNKPTVKIFTKANPDFSLTIRDDKVVLARSDPTDPAQHWFKDEKYSTRVKDVDGFPSFALVNRATGLAIKHSIGATHPVQVIPYNPEILDESILWTESKDFGNGYRAIRMVNNIQLNVDAFHGDQYSGGVRDDTPIVLWDWKHGDNQLWKIIPY